MVHLGNVFRFRIVFQGLRLPCAFQLLCSVEQPLSQAKPGSHSHGGGRKVVAAFETRVVLDRVEAIGVFEHVGGNHIGVERWGICTPDGNKV